jgi:hypothetical protein
MLGVVKIIRRLVRATDAIGNLYARQASSIYKFSELGQLSILPLRAAKPRPKFGVVLRVNAMGRSNNNADQKYRTPLFWMAKEALRGRVVARDWRQRSRATLDSAMSAFKAA